MRTPYLDIRPTYLLLYELSNRLPTNYNHSNNNTTTHNNHKTTKPVKKPTTYTNTLTPYARKKLIRAIQLLVASAQEKEAPNWKTNTTYKFKLNFITLTLSDDQGTYTDKDIKKLLLDPFIKRMKRKYGLRSYIWRAEKQKNGRLHFHLITDTWIHYNNIRSDWNALQDRLGLLDNFYKQHHHRNANSTDIHAIKKVKNITAYFIKYMSKATPPDLTVQGKQWDCSENLKKKRYCRLPFNDICNKAWTRLKRTPKAKEVDTPHCSLLYFNPKYLRTHLPEELLSLYDAFLQAIRENLPFDCTPTHPPPALAEAT